MSWFRNTVVIIVLLMVSAAMPVHGADNNNDLNTHDTRFGASLFSRLFDALTRCRGEGSGSPVRLVDGAFIWSDTDIVLNGRPRLSLTRFYNSFDARDGIFGKGWSTRCEKTLIRVVDFQQSDEGVSEPRLVYIYRTALGRRYRFEETVTGGFLSPDGLSDIALTVNTDGTAQLTGQDRSVERYNALGKLVSEVDRNGNAINYSYQNGVLAGIADTNGRRLSFTFDSSGHVSTVADHTGRQWQYTYNVEGTLASVTDPAGGQLRYNYVPLSRPADGNQYYAISQITDASGVVLTDVTYTEDGRVNSYSEGENVFTYDVRRDGYIYKTDSMRSRWSYKLDENGNKTEVWSPSSSRHPDRFVYNQDGQLTGYTDRAQTAFSYDYDLLGRVIETTTPDGVTRYAYYENTDWVSQVTSVSGRVVTLRYDANGNIVSVSDPGGNTLTYTFTESGDLATATNALGHAISIDVNSVGQTIGATDPLNRSSSYTYDSRGNLRTMTNAADGVMTLEYDVLDRLIQSTDALGRTVQYEYDAAGRILRVSDPAGGATEFAYDQFGRLTSETRADGSVYTSQYRLDNLLESSTDPRGVVTTYTYDNSKRITGMRAGRISHSYRYDTLDRLTSTSGGSAGIALTYDVMSRLLTETQGRTTIAYTYNSEGELVGMDALGESMSYEYDNRGLLESLVTPLGTHRYTHDAAGRLVSHAYPSGATATMSYDGAGQLLRQDYSQLGGAVLDYTYDNLARVTAIAGKGSDVWTYEYDAINRLVAGTQDQRFSFSYDALGNRLDAGGSYDAFNRLLENNSHVFGYDAAGNLTSRIDKTTGEQMRLDYNGLGRLSDVEFAPEADARASSTVQYAYDAFGRRGRKTVDNIRTDFVWQGSNLLSEIQSGGGPSRTYRYDGGHAALEYADGVESHFVLSDHIGSAHALVSASSGDLTWQLNSDPYGKPLSTDAVDQPGFNQRFPGQYFDRESGLSYNMHRYYDSSTGRYTRADPIGLAGGLNHYAYAQSSPVHFYDSSGLAAETVVDVVSLGMSVNDFRKCRSIANGFFVLLDGVSVAVPFLPAVGIVRHGAKLNDVDNLVDLSSPARRRHILDGEVRPNGSFGGGHRGGTGFPGKSEFPTRWSDDQLMHHVSDVATDPLSTTRPGRGNDVFVQGRRDGIDIEVLIRNGEIWTAYPTNVPRNP